jgi:hypothetical protein
MTTTTEVWALPPAVQPDGRLACRAASDTCRVTRD